jgi:integrase
MGSRCPLRGDEGHGSWYLSLELPAAPDGRRRRIRRGGASRAELPTARRPKAVVWTAERVTEWQRTGIRPSVAVWTPAQTAEFLNVIRGHRPYAAYHLIGLRGLRRGEACGLRWCDIDLDSGTAIICWQLQQYDGHVVLCPPKTAHSERIIALDRTTVAALRAHRARQLAERAAAGEDYLDSGYVFTRPNGDPMAPDWLSRYFRQLNDASGLPPIRLHDLRHGAASLYRFVRLGAGGHRCRPAGRARQPPAHVGNVCRQHCGHPGLRPRRHRLPAPVPACAALAGLGGLGGLARDAGSG